jgi:hypothetical protein
LIVHDPQSMRDRSVLPALRYRLRMIDDAKQMRLEMYYDGKEKPQKSPTTG